MTAKPNNILHGAGSWLWSAQPAQAIRDVQLPDGSVVTAYELEIALKIVALRGSVPSDAILEFRHALSKYGRFQLAQKPQIADIFEELGQPRSLSLVGEMPHALLHQSYKKGHANCLKAYSGFLQKEWADCHSVSL